jgi:hypothetical protein
MRLVAQRVVRPSDQASGVNAYCYVHPGVGWLDALPTDLGRGTLVGRLIEVSPPSGNRVRSYLEVTTPDETSARSIIEVVLSGAELLAAREQELPWQMAHGETSFEFNVEVGLAEHWLLELRILLGYALQARSLRP